MCIISWVCMHNPNYSVQMYSVVNNGYKTNRNIQFERWRKAKSEKRKAAAYTGIQSELITGFRIEITHPHPPPGLFISNEIQYLDCNNTYS